MPPFEANTCPTCGGPGFIDDDYCPTCYGNGSLPITGHARLIKKIADIEDKVNDVLDKCNDILEAING